MTDLRCERQLEFTISRTAVAIATPPTISTNPRMLDSACIVTPVNQSSKSNRNRHSHNYAE